MTDNIPIPVQPPGRAGRIAELMRKRVVSEGDCWIWQGRIDKAGYGYACADGQTRLAHQLFYEFFIGEIPDGLEIDHRCRRRNCVNPFHLEAVTHMVNMDRAITVGKHARSPECPHGHAFTPENTIRGNGSRYCRECYNAKQRARYARMEEQFPVSTRTRGEIADRFRELRSKRGLTQKELAAELGCSMGFIAMIETGRRKPNADMQDLFDQLAATAESA